MPNTIEMEPKSATKPDPTTEKPAETGTIKGNINCPWGVVALATVRVEDRSVISDRNGKFEIKSLDAGPHTVNVEPPFPGYDSAPQKVVVVAGQTKCVDFYLDFAKTTVHGYVYDKDGKPIPGAILSDVMCGKDLKNTVTDGTGYFKFEGASPGNLFIRVNATGYMSETRDFAAKRSEKTKLEFRLTPTSCKISGFVLGEDGSPLGGEVYLSSVSMVILQKVPSNAGNRILRVFRRSWNLQYSCQCGGSQF